MRLRNHSALLLALVVAASAPFTARADEIGGSGFDVPQAAAAEEWLWGVEGLVRTPVDLSVDFGFSSRNWEVDGRTVYDDSSDSATIVSRTGTLEFEPQAIEGGFRIAGGIGYWSCCVLIEPAMAFRANRPLGSERDDSSPSISDPTGPFSDRTWADVEVQSGWELLFGPQMTWMIPDDTPFLGGLPLVFFPVLGVTHIDWDATIVATNPGFPPSGWDTADRTFEDDAFTVGFDLDIPLPGSVRDFTHAITFGFRWIEGNDDHDLGPFALDSASGGSIPAGSGGCTSGNDEACFNFDGLEGWKVGVSYRITWHDFEGFFKRTIFGPVQ